MQVRVRGSSEARLSSLCRDSGFSRLVPCRLFSSLARQGADVVGEQRSLGGVVRERERERERKKGKR
jgi:hypothetical protein